MISERELRQIAAKSGVGVAQSEHEYVLLCVLEALARTPPLADTFCLKGGTALRLVHFNDWRHSVDLDFSVLPTWFIHRQFGPLPRPLQPPGRSRPASVNKAPGLVS